MAKNNKIQIELDLNDRDAKKKLKELANEVGDTEDALEDAESAGKKMARAMERAAEDMISEIDSTKRAVDALERALGPDFDADTRDVVADLKAVGLTAQDIEEDAEELAKALRKVDDVKISAKDAGFTDLDQALGKTTDNSRTASTAIGGIGNSISELPGVGSLGPVAESMGMLAENALEGEANIKGLVVAGGGLAALGLVMNVISKGMESVAETKAFHKERVENFADAVGEVGEGVEAVNEALSETGRLTGRTGGFAGFFEDTNDVTKELVELGYTQQEVNTAIAEGGPLLAEIIDRYNDLADAAEAEAKANISNESVKDAAIANMQRYRATVEVLTETRADYVKGVEEGTITEQYGTSATEEAAEAAEKKEAATERATEALEAEVDALQESITALEEQTEAQRASVDAAYAVEEATFDLIDATTEATEIFAVAEVGSREYREAQLDVIESAQKLADAEVRKAEETAAATGKTLTATQKQDAFTSSLLNTAANLNGPARQAVLDHIGRLNNIPASKMTEINALLDAGDIAGAEAAINNASRTRATTVKVDADNDSLNDTELKLAYLARARSTELTVTNSGLIRRNARGSTYYEGGPTWVGEEGPEILDLPKGSQITNAGQSAFRARNESGGGTTNIYQNFPAGTRPIDVVKAQRDWRRVQGPT